jgi:hypothetical protein
MKRFGILILGIYLTWGILPAWGDVTIESTHKSSGFKGMGASEGTTVKRYQVDKVWNSASTKFTGVILSRVAGDTETVTITRVDRGVSWILDPKKKIYEENPIEPISKQEGAREPREKEKPKVRVTKSELSVKKTGASETIHGFPCEEYLVTWLLEMEEIETKAKSQSTMTMNLWTTPETAAIRKAQTEEREFHKAYAQKIGIKISGEEANQMGLAAMASMSGASPEDIEKGMARVKEEMAKIQGYPIRTVVRWGMDSEKTAAAKEEKTSDSILGSSGSIGGAVTGLASRFLQKKVEEKAAPSAGKEAPFFSSTLEVKSINVDPIPSGIFDIPSGYTKK